MTLLLLAVLLVLFAVLLAVSIMAKETVASLVLFAVLMFVCFLIAIEVTR